MQVADFPFEARFRGRWGGYRAGTRGGV